MLLLDWTGVVEKAHREPAYAAADASHHLVARTNGDNDEPARADIVCKANKKRKKGIISTQKVRRGLHRFYGEATIWELE